jgi:site-specific recombinase XerD
MTIESNQQQGFRLISGDPIARDIESFLLDRQAQCLSLGTVASYRQKLLTWCHMFASLGVRRVEDITPQHLHHCLLELSKTHNPGGVHAFFRVIRTFLRWWEEETEPRGWCNPLIRVKAPKRPHNVLEPLFIPHFKRMLATCDRSFIGQRDRALMLCLLDSGARASEFIALNVADVDLTTGCVVIRCGKRGKFRTVFLGVQSRRQLHHYLELRPQLRGTEPLWVNEMGARLTLRALRQILRRRAQEADVPTPSLRSFRHSFILFCRREVDPSYLQKLFGDDLSSIQRYLTEVYDELREVHARCSPVNQLP